MALASLSCNQTNHCFMVLATFITIVNYRRKTFIVQAIDLVLNIPILQLLYGANSFLPASKGADVQKHYTISMGIIGNLSMQQASWVSLWLYKSNKKA